MGKISKSIFYQTLQQAGLCCPFHYFQFLEKNPEITNTEIAERLGFHIRTIQLWRQAYREGFLTPCENTSPPTIANFKIK